MRGINRGTIGFLAFIWVVGMGFALMGGEPVGMIGLLLVLSAVYLVFCLFVGWVIGLFRRP